MSNRLQLSEESLKATKEELQQVMGRLPSIGKMTEDEKLDFSGRWNSWYSKFLIRTAMIGGYLEEYVTDGPVHPLLTPYHNKIIDDLLLFTVSHTLVNQIKSVFNSGCGRFECFDRA